MPFEPHEHPPSTAPFFQDVTSDHGTWVPFVSHGCTFDPEAFSRIMMNMIHNPNLNSTWLYRADILYDDVSEALQDSVDGQSDSLLEIDKPICRNISNMTRRRTLVRKLIPRSEKRDRPLNQTCSYHHAQDAAENSVTTLVVYLPHASSLQDLPFYHPKVRGIAHLHQWNPLSNTGTISVHFLGDAECDLTDIKLTRVAYHLLEILYKHGQGSTQGYVKRVHHDLVIPQARFQDRYAQLKGKYARHLVDTWAEVTDPGKHVFEDLGIAAFLMELWAGMYKDGPFPGFVDIGCGNGLLVYILRQEGYEGWGFDARARKSWPAYSMPSSTSPTGRSLEERLLLPTITTSTTPSSPRALSTNTTTTAAAAAAAAASDHPDPDNQAPFTQPDPSKVHNGTFKPDTFIISNHADELTPWTPILGALSQCPFLMIPCCSHNLTGDKFRARPPRDKAKSRSTYASLVDWVSCIAEDCGWEVETEMLRIPSTRNTGILGRARRDVISAGDVAGVVAKYGGVEGYLGNVMKLVKGGPRGH
ncbi:hypothetical protein E4U60_002774 [Claviceps pazoutovae]|uniref:tRNA (uracil-O(2)-)-methyltransferase n=1 Tax=Claviceps pazoutovae TaxID=1649127 RepID=A0A9P7SKS6_9HYPO|nr:hypothetical protein E4U60_002774 [Claviceps pazoutovae]